MKETMKIITFVGHASCHFGAYGTILKMMHVLNGNLVVFRDRSE